MSSPEPRAHSHPPPSKPNKRLSTDRSDLERPIKRLHISNAGQSGSSLGMSGLEPISTDAKMDEALSPPRQAHAPEGSSNPKGKGRAATESMDVDVEGLIPAPKKWEGKGKLKVCPLLPDDIWRRVFDFLFDSYRQDWHREIPVTNTLDSLLICKDLGNIATSILYSHPHIHHDAIPQFIHSFSRPSTKPKDARLPHVRDVTIRPSPTYFALSTGESATLHPRLGELLKVLPDQLNSITLRETLITDSNDKDELFAALKLVKPRKARLEIRFWDLSQSPIGRDLLAATRPGPYFTTSASFRRPANGEGNDPNAAQRAAMPPVVHLPPMQAPELRSFQEMWRSAMIMRDELEIPMRWLEDEREVQAQAAAAQAAQQAAQVQNQAQIQAIQGQLIGLNNPNAPNAGAGAAAMLGGGGIGSAAFGAGPGAVTGFQTAGSMPANSGPNATAWRAPQMAARQARMDQLRLRAGSRSSAQAGSSSQGAQPTPPTWATIPRTTSDGTTTAIAADTTSTTTATDSTATAEGEGSTGQANPAPAESSNEAAAAPNLVETAPQETAQVDETPAEGVHAEATGSDAPVQPDTQSSASRYSLRPRDSATEQSAATPTAESTAAPAPHSGGEEQVGYPMRPEDRDRVTDTRAWLERFSKRVTQSNGSGSQPGFKWIPKEEVRETKPGSWFISPKREAEQSESGPAPGAEVKVEEPPAGAPAPAETSTVTSKQASGLEQDAEMKEDVPAAGQVDGMSGESSDAKQSSQGGSTTDGVSTAVATSNAAADANPANESAVSRKTNDAPGTSCELSSDPAPRPPMFIGTGVDPAHTRFRSTRQRLQFEQQTRFAEADDDSVEDISAAMDRAGEIDISPSNSPTPGSPVGSAGSDVEDQEMQEALYRSRVDNFAGFADPPAQLSQNTNLLSFASAGAGSTPSVPPPNNNLRYIRRHGSAGSLTAVVNLNHPNNIITGIPPPVRFASAYLPHTFREALFELFDQHWCPDLQAFSFVALDPHASVIAQAPRLDFWNRVAVSRIRVHLPRCINSLAVFKGLKENRRDRRKRQRDRLAASAPAGQADTEPASDDHIIVGGDGSGGDLVHESNRLFEIEVNTVEEMEDVVWIQGGDQLPPQVCRILAGSHDWSDVPIDFHEPSPSRINEAIAYTPSPATSQFASPTFSWASGSCDEVMSEFNLDTRPDAGANYDAEAARAQSHRQKSKLAQVEGADDEMEDGDEELVDEDLRRDLVSLSAGDKRV